MPSPKELITNDENTVTDISRGRVECTLHYVGNYVFADIRTGKRVARTAFYDSMDTGSLLGDILERLGFIPWISTDEVELM